MTYDHDDRMILRSLGHLRSAMDAWEETEAQRHLCEWITTALLGHADGLGFVQEAVEPEAEPDYVDRVAPPTLRPGKRSLLTAHVFWELPGDLARRNDALLTTADGIADVLTVDLRCTDLSKHLDGLPPARDLIAAVGVPEGWLPYQRVPNPNKLSDWGLARPMDPATWDLTSAWSAKPTATNLTRYLPDLAQALADVAAFDARLAKAQKAR